MKRLIHSIFFRITFVVLLAETIALLGVSTYINNRFANEIDQRIIANVKKPGQLMAQGVLNYDAVSDPQIIYQLVGEELVNGMIVGINGNIFHSLHSSDTGQSIFNVPEINPQWFAQAKNQGLILPLKEGRDSYLVSVTPLQTVDQSTSFLYAFIQVRTNESEAQKHTMQNVLYGVFFASISLTTLLISLIFRQEVLKPLQKTLAVVGQAQSGKLDSLIQQPFAENEIGEMQHGINKMIARLQESFKMMEKQVADTRQAEAAVRQSEERLSMALKGAKLGIWDWNIETGETIYDEGWLHMLGYQQGEIHSHIGSWENLMHPDDIPEAMRRISESFTGKTPFFSMEHRLCTQSGEWKWILSRGQIVARKPDGTPLRMAGTHLDLDDIKKTEEALRFSEEKFAKAFYTSPDAISINRLSDGAYLEINAGFTALTGYTAEDVLGKTTEEVSVFNNLEHRAQIVNQLNEKKSMQGIETRFRTKEGRLRYVMISASIMEINGEECILSITRDMTDHKQSERKIHRLNEGLEQRVRERTAQFEQANQELEAFAYSISHDLRSPLRSVAGYIGILIEEYFSSLPEDGQHYLRRIQDNAERMEKLIESLLAFSRFGRQPLNRYRISMRDLVEQSLDILRQEMDFHRVDLLIGSLPACHADPLLLRQVFLNLLSNALKYTSKRSRALIEIGYTTVDDKNAYYVRDNGIGLDMAEAHKLFNVFQRLHSEEEFEGTGVGLAIVQRIIHRHHGQVWVESQPGQGAVFFFTIGPEEAEQQ